jgi:tRNA A37 threonylcarbamoyladenosine modification protein TsaB
MENEEFFIDEKTEGLVFIREKNNIANVDIVAITIVSPLQIGIYKDSKLIETIINSGKTSDVLPLIFSEILDIYSINSITYTKGPGGYMAIKLAYVFFKTICLVKNIKLLASDAFLFNDNSPISGIGKMCFIKKRSGEIAMERCDNFKQAEFALPQTIDLEKFSKDTEPLYIAPAV